MPQHADEVTPVKIRNDTDGCISSSAANGDDREILAGAVVGSACGREKHTGREWERNGGGGDKSPGAPFLKYFQKRGHSTFSKFTVEISRSGGAGDSECEISADDRARCRDGCILVPWVAVSGRENRDQDIRAAKCWQRRAIKDREKE